MMVLCVPDVSDAVNPSNFVSQSGVNFHENRSVLPQTSVFVVIDEYTHDQKGVVSL